ncbi:phage repressor protein CI [Pantoea phytobeneficialis]|uniref:Phage repressor protein CI n=1 Tax=Pantoea phytobeneficialis TaxID=2052056 RepID=A0AAP9H8X0_9GAMM|nr:phage repressor protein CI [Pantoea phytobeneficialis]MDO6408692.1 phage repressor protein CI [Pantoea phytobeneficialis]QGR08783.1 phage repressor protein CI [Pantoea phytobeneficialis]
MIEEKGGSAQILERLMSSYGVNTQKDLASALEIPPNNISGWTQRDSVPGNAIIKCALDTGVDLRWLVTGELANANYAGVGQLVGGDLYKQIISNGGKPVLRRIMDAYGFTMQKQLCELLGISSGTVSTWVRRNHFPGEVVVTCALDTGVSLQWLATGKGLQQKENAQLSVSSSIPRKNLVAGILQDAGYWEINLSFIAHTISEPIFISSNTGAWIVDMSVAGISNGRWLLGVDDKYDIYNITLLPGRRISVTNKGNTFSCGVDEVTAVGKVVIAMDFVF